MAARPMCKSIKTNREMTWKLRTVFDPFRVGMAGLAPKREGLGPNDGSLLVGLRDGTELRGRPLRGLSVHLEQLVLRRGNLRWLPLNRVQG